MRSLQITLAWVAALLMAVACGKGAPAEPAGALAVPEGVKLHGTAAETSLTFQWNAVEGATGYDWKLSTEGEADLAGNVASRNVTVSGLVPGTGYQFSVRAVAGTQASAWSTPVTAKTAGVRPTPGVNCVDAPLVIEVGASASLGTSGKILVYKDGVKDAVDVIDLADMAKVQVLEDGTLVPAQKLETVTASHSFMNELYSGSSKRVVHYTPLRLKGGKLYVSLHNNVLGFGGSYYLTMDESVAGKAIGKGEFTFTTKAAPSGTTLSVNPDGSGDFCTVQGALTYAATLGKDTPVTIEVGEGTYPELLFLQGKNNVTLQGVSREKSVIAYPNSENYVTGSDNRCLFLAKSCTGLTLEKLTVENTYYASDHKGQAEAVYFNAADNGRLTIEDCALISWQDTFLCKGEVYVHKSLIAGHCDYIWGYPKACLFEDCEIRSRATGYIVQARVQNAANKGFVFLNCRLTAESGVADGKMYLARSAGQADCYDNVTYVNCAMSPVIASVGWLGNPVPNPSTPTATAGWKEYGTTGVSTSSRNAYGKVLTAAEAEGFSSRQAVLGW